MSAARMTSIRMNPSHLLIALAIGIAIVMSGVVLTWQVASRVLHDDAREQALHWSQYIERNLSDLDGIIAGDDISEEDARILSLARDAGNIFRYHIFDRTGRIMFSSDYLDEGQGIKQLVGHESKQLESSLFDGDILIELNDGRERENRPDDYAEAYAPLFDGDRLRGVIEVYIDQTEKMARYWNDIGVLIIGIAVLLALAAVLPGAFVRMQYERLRAAEAHIFELAYRDTLTGLPNRRMFMDELERSLDHAIGNGDFGALLMFDLDHFKTVNDTLGHNAGDDLLRVVVTRVEALLSDADVLARIGGDEFAIICRTNVDGSSVELLAQRIVDAINDPISTSEGEASVGASIGIVMFPEHGSEPNTVLKNADIALYRAKESGRATYCHFDETMQQQVLARHQIEVELRSAVDDDQFELYFQPIFDVQKNQILAIEALMRWRHPKDGLLAAGTFLTQLPDSELLGRLGQLALNKACAAAAVLTKNGYQDVAVAVNCSRAQLQNPFFVDEITIILNDYGLPSSSLTLEITELAVIGRHSERAMAVMHELRRKGFKLALDDFGVGYASLNHLKRLPIDQVKIDKSLVRGIGHSAEDGAIIKSVVTLAKFLDIEVVAEGVETQLQLENVRLQERPFAQGIGLAPPMLLDELLNLLADSQVGKLGKFAIDGHNIRNFEVNPA